MDPMDWANYYLATFGYPEGYDVAVPFQAPVPEDVQIPEESPTPPSPPPRERAGP